MSFVYAPMVSGLTKESKDGKKDERDVLRKERQRKELIQVVSNAPAVQVQGNFLFP